MRLRELDNLLVSVLSDSSPDIVDAEPITRGLTCNRVRVRFTSGASAIIMVRAVTGPGIPRHQLYRIPDEAL